VNEAILVKTANAMGGLLLTALSALGFSTLPIFGIFAYRFGANVTTLLGLRFALAAVLLWALLLASRRALPDRRTGWQLLLMGGAGYTTMSFLYLSSVEGDRLSPSLAALLLYTYPAIVALLARFFDQDRLRPAQYAALAVTLLGVALVLLSADDGARFTPAGAALALGAALVYGVYIVFGSRVTRKTSPLAATTYVSTAAAAVFLGYGALSGQLVLPSPPGWWAIAGTAIFSTVLAVLLFFAGIERLGPSRASIISTLEPVGTALLAAVLLGDRLTPLQLGGGALVLGGIVWLQLRS
jgi:drug/metabolite transporter (DMT)-like permease